MVKKDVIRIRLFRIIVICTACLVTGWAPEEFLMQDEQSRLKIEEMIRSIPDLSASEYRELNHAFQSEFGRNGNSLSMPDSQMISIQHIIQAGIFEEIPSSRIAEIAYKAYLAECKGNDPRIVEDLVLIGFARSISAEQLEVASRQLSRFFKTDIDPYIYQDIISYGLANGWSPQTLADVSEGLIRGHQSGVDGQKLALALIIRVDQNEAKIPISSLVEEEIRSFQVSARQNTAENQRQDAAFKWMQRAIQAGISESVSRELYFKAVNGNWNEISMDALFNGMIQAYNMGLIPEKVALAMIIRMEKGLGKTSPVQMVQEEIAYVKSKEKKRLQSVNKDNMKDFPKPIPSPQRYSVFVEPKRKEPKPVIYTQASRLQLNKNTMIESIRSYLGTPYRWGGNSRYGIDCSGFTQAVYREQGIYIPRVSRQQFQIGKPIASENLQFGDLVFFNKYGYGTISHVGIYIGNGQFVHATTREGVAVSSFNKRYYRIRYVGAKRLV